MLVCRGNFQYFSMSKCKVNSDQIERSFKVMNHVVKGNQALPILENAVVWQEKKAKTLCIGATNLELGCIIELGDVQFSGSGSMISCPKVKTMLDVIKEICTTDLKLSVKDGDEKKREGGTTVIETSDDDVFEIKGDLVNEYPIINLPGYAQKFSPLGDEKHDYEHYLYSMELSMGAFDDIIKRVVPACATTSLRPVLTGVSVDIEDGKLTFAGTDSYRLSELSFGDGDGYKMEYGQFHKTIVPSSAFELMDKAMKSFGANEETKITFLGEVHVSRHDEDYKSDNMDVKAGDIRGEVVQLACFKMQIGSVNVIVSTRCIDGQYPDYKQVIPDKKKHEKLVEFSIDRNVLSRVVKSSHVFAKDVNNNMHIKFHADKKYMEVCTPETSKGRFTKKVNDIDCVEFNDNQIALSTQYLMSAIKIMDGSDMTFQIFDSVHPALVRMKERDMGEFMHIIMPLRIQE